MPWSASPNLSRYSGPHVHSLPRPNTTTVKELYSSTYTPQLGEQRLVWVVSMPSSPFPGQYVRQQSGSMQSSAPHNRQTARSEGALLPPRLLAPAGAWPCIGARRWLRMKKSK